MDIFDEIFGGLVEIANVVDVTISVRDALAGFSGWRSRVDEADVVSWTVPVVDVACAEVNRASVDYGGHAVHLVAAKQRSLHARLADAEHVNRFDFLCRPIRPEVVFVSNGESKWIRKLVSHDSWLLGVWVNAWEINEYFFEIFVSFRRTHIQSSGCRHQHNRFRLKTWTRPTNLATSLAVN